MRWRLYYSDESTFDSSQGTWDEAPSWGVIAFTTPDSVTGRRTPNSVPFYVRDADDHLFGMDLAGLLDHLRRVGHPEAHKPLHMVDLEAIAGRVKFGRYVPKDVFERILIHANDDPDFPRRSARDSRSPETGAF